MSGKFEVVTIEELRRRYSMEAFQIQRTRLDPNHVPQNLKPLIGLAEFWGISDDFLRGELFDKAPVTAKHELKESVSRFKDELNEWLTGPESYLKNPSNEYVAFSAMRMVADMI